MDGVLILLWSFATGKTPGSRNATDGISGARPPAKNPLPPGRGGADGEKRSPLDGSKTWEAVNAARLGRVDEWRLTPPRRRRLWIREEQPPACLI
jgi:hypothetical protein